MCGPFPSNAPKLVEDPRPNGIHPGAKFVRAYRSQLVSGITEAATGCSDQSRSSRVLEYRRSLFKMIRASKRAKGWKGRFAGERSISAIRVRKVSARTQFRADCVARSSFSLSFSLLETAARTVDFGFSSTEFSKREQE